MEITFEELVGKTLIDIQINNYNDEIIFITDNYKKYKLYHSKNCCEKVNIESIDGDLNDLLGNPILMAKMTTNNNHKGGHTYDAGSFTWTFYKLATVKGYVDIRWYGSSNGYYSEKVDFCEIVEDYLDD